MLFICWRFWLLFDRTVVRKETKLEVCVGGGSGKVCEQGLEHGTAEESAAHEAIGADIINVFCSLWELWKQFIFIHNVIHNSSRGVGEKNSDSFKTI